MTRHIYIYVYQIIKPVQLQYMYTNDNIEISSNRLIN